MIRRLAGPLPVRIGGLAFLALVAYCLLAPLVSPYEPNAVDLAASRQGPSLAHPLGTDQFGRDLLVRLAAGGRTSLLIAFSALAVILVLGVAYGSLAALAGGRADSLLMRLLDGLFALPRLPVSIVVLVLLGLQAQNVAAVVLALSIVNWMLTARLVRGQLLDEKGREYVRAARALGASPYQVARRHLLPNSYGIVVVAIFLELPGVVLGEAFLSVLGLGPEAPTATWGNIALEGIRYERLWVVLLPTLAIAAFAVSANLVADGLGDALDPRRRVGSLGRRRRVRPPRTGTRVACSPSPPSSSSSSSRS